MINLKKGSLYWTKTIDKIRQPFQQGLQAKDIVKASIVSFLLSIIPVFGVTTILITISSIKFKLNLPLMIVVSYLAYPLQFLLFLPFIKIGETIFNMQHSMLSFQEIKIAFSTSIWQALKDLSIEILCGFSAWLLIAVPLSFLFLLINESLFKFINQK